MEQDAVSQLDAERLRVVIVVGRAESQIGVLPHLADTLQTIQECLSLHRRQFYANKKSFASTLDNIVTFAYCHDMARKKIKNIRRVVLLDGPTNKILRLRAFASDRSVGSLIREAINDYIGKLTSDFSLGDK